MAIVIDHLQARVERDPGYDNVVKKTQGEGRIKKTCCGNLVDSK